MKINPVLRATGVIGTVAALVTGVTFAALSSTATLTNNTIASATASLLVDNTDDTTVTTTPATTDVGYDFVGIVPGSPTGSNTGNFTLQNAGDTDVAITVKLDGAPVWTGGPVDDSKVDVAISCTGGTLGAFGVTADVAALVAGPVALAPANLANGETATCTVKVLMDVDAFTGSGVTSDDFNFVFEGTAV